MWWCVVSGTGGWNDPILHPVNYVVTRAIRLLQPLIVERNRRLEPNYITIQDQRNWVGFFIRFTRTLCPNRHVC
jgi:hypothetical protein